MIATGSHSKTLSVTVQGWSLTRVAAMDRWESPWLATWSSASIRKNRGCFYGPSRMSISRGARRKSQSTEGKHEYEQQVDRAGLGSDTLVVAAGMCSRAGY